MFDRTQRDRQLERLAKDILAGDGVTFLTGAGISTASGLPDFRGRDGLWDGGPLGEILTAEGARDQFPEFTRFCKTAVAEVQKHKPNAAHLAIAMLQNTGIVDHVITQNVDNYHTDAGSKEVLAVHGNLMRIRCERCSAMATPENYLKPNGEWCLCLGRRRPEIVLFREALKPQTLVASLEAIAATRVLVVVGSTLAVAPICYATAMVKENDGKVAIINGEATAHDVLADFKLRGDITMTIGELYNWVVKLDRTKHGLPDFAQLESVA